MALVLPLFVCPSGGWTESQGASAESWGVSQLGDSLVLHTGESLPGEEPSLGTNRPHASPKPRQLERAKESPPEREGLAKVQAQAVQGGAWESAFLTSPSQCCCCPWTTLSSKDRELP